MRRSNGRARAPPVHRRKSCACCGPPADREQVTSRLSWVAVLLRGGGGDGGDGAAAATRTAGRLARAPLAVRTCVRAHNRRAHAFYYRHDRSSRRVARQLFTVTARMALARVQSPSEYAWPILTAAAAGRVLWILPHARSGKKANNLRVATFLQRLRSAGVGSSRANARDSFGGTTRDVASRSQKCRRQHRRGVAAATGWHEPRVRVATVPGRCRRRGHRGLVAVAKQAGHRLHRVRRRAARRRGRGEGERRQRDRQTDFVHVTGHRVCTWKTSYARANANPVQAVAHTQILTGGSKMSIKTLTTSPFLIINVCYSHFRVAVATPLGTSGHRRFGDQKCVYTFHRCI